MNLTNYLISPITQIVAPEAFYVPSKKRQSD